jgi:hypothetical protein
MIQETEKASNVDYQLFTRPASQEVERTESLQQFATPKLRNRAFWRQFDKSIKTLFGVMVTRRLYMFKRSSRKAVTYSPALKIPTLTSQRFNYCNVRIDNRNMVFEP